MKRVLLTGASGFLGAACIEPLLARGFEVHTVSRRALRLDPSRVTEHHIDLTDQRTHAVLMDLVRPSHLLHSAWTTKPAFETAKDGAITAAWDHYDWVTTGLNLVRTFSSTGGKRLVVCGSSAEYDWSYGYCTEQLTPTVPDTEYGACKHALRILVESFVNSRKLSAAWPRIFFCYGPGEAPRRLVASAILSLLNGKPALFSHGNQVRDYMHVADVALALVQLLDSGVQGPVNVASGRGIAIKEIVSTVGSLLGRPELIHLGAIPARTNDQPFVVGNNQRLVSELRWQQQIDLTTGLRQTIDWWLRNPPHSEAFT